MLKRMRNIYLLSHEIYGQPKKTNREEFLKLSETERFLVDPQIEDDVYTIKTPKEVTAEEMYEIINIQISNDIGTIKKYLGEIKFIMTFCFVSLIIAAVIAILASMVL